MEFELDPHTGEDFKMRNVCIKARSIVTEHWPSKLSYTKDGPSLKLVTKYLLTTIYGRGASRVT